MLLCHYNSFAEVVNQALGGGSDKNADREDITAFAPTFEHAVAMINGALNLG